MNSTFWHLDTPHLRGLAQETLDTEYDTVVCPENANHRRGGKRLSDLSVIVDPSHIRDFTWTWGSDVLVSKKVLDLFEKHRVTGFEVRPIKISYSKPIKARPPDLFELVVTGWGGFAAPAAGVSLLRSCPACGHRVYAIAKPSRLIDAAAWDGSDLFIVWPLPLYRFASDRLVSILRQERVSGVKAFPASAIPMKQGDSATPGPLALSMPENRARELEQRYGISIS
jgi:hypothetical protein